MTENESLENRALAAAAEVRERERESREQSEQKAREWAARKEAEEREKLIPVGIREVQRILGHATVTSDWKIRKEQRFEGNGWTDGELVDVTVAYTVILGVEISTGKRYPESLEVSDWPHGELTLASFGRALEARKEAEERLEASKVDAEDKLEARKKGAKKKRRHKQS